MRVEHSSDFCRANATVCDKQPRQKSLNLLQIKYYEVNLACVSANNKQISKAMRHPVDDYGLGPSL